LFRKTEVEWFLNGMGRIFPEAARAYLSYLPEAERQDPLAAYHRRLTDANPLVHMPAAQVWCRYEEACSRLIPESGDGRPSPAALSMARIEAHYMVNNGFMADNQLLHGLPRLHGLPAVIVQGRYDIICPMTSADELTRAWPGAVLHVVPDGGHSALDPGILRALVAATDQFRNLLQLP